MFKPEPVVFSEIWHRIDVMIPHPMQYLSVCIIKEEKKGVLRERRDPWSGAGKVIVVGSHRLCDGWQKWNVSCVLISTKLLIYHFADKNPSFFQEIVLKWKMAPVIYLKGCIRLLRAVATIWSTILSVDPKIDNHFNSANLQKPFPVVHPKTEIIHVKMFDKKLI